jgi:hypothetical protein
VHFLCRFYENKPDGAGKALEKITAAKPPPNGAKGSLVDIVIKKQDIKISTQQIKKKRILTATARRRRYRLKVQLQYINN